MTLDELDRTVQAANEAGQRLIELVREQGAIGYHRNCGGLVFYCELDMGYEWKCEKCGCHSMPGIDREHLLLTEEVERVE